MSTILLNSTMEVLAFIPWQRAVSMMVAGEVELLKSVPGKMVRSPSISVPMPEVIYLRRYIDTYRFVSPRDMTDFAVKKAILERDRYTCAYCGKRGRTIDHIFPKSRGGQNSWANLVASCYPCNGRKDDRTPEEAGMKLLWTPSAMDPYDAAQKMVWDYLEQLAGAPSEVDEMAMA